MMLVAKQCVRVADPFSLFFDQTIRHLNKRKKKGKKKEKFEGIC